MPRNELLQTPRVDAVLITYQELYARAQESIRQKHQIEHLHAQLEAQGQITQDLPVRLRQLVLLAAQRPLVSVDAVFGHFREYNNATPRFLFDISWERIPETDESAVINMLHFEIPEDPQETLIENFRTIDSKTAYSLFGGKIEDHTEPSALNIPERLRQAVITRREMGGIIGNLEYQIGLSEELGSLPYS